MECSLLYAGDPETLNAAHKAQRKGVDLTEAYVKKFKQERDERESSKQGPGPDPALGEARAELGRAVIATRKLFKKVGQLMRPQVGKLSEAERTKHWEELQSVIVAVQALQNIVRPDHAEQFHEAAE